VNRAEQLYKSLYSVQCKQFQSVDSMLLGQVRWAVFQTGSKISGKDSSAILPTLKKLARMSSYLKAAHMLT